MDFQLIDISVRDRQAHPRLAGRVTGHVSAVLLENTDGHEQTHALTIPVWADVAAGTSDGDIDMALMLKAADIIARLKASLSPGSSP
jgi:hypothetical protein